MAADHASTGAKFRPAHRDCSLNKGDASSPSLSTSQLWDAGCYLELSSRFASELAEAEASLDRQRVIDSANDLACAHRAAGNQATAAYFQLLSATTERDSAPDGVGRISATSMGNLACDAILCGKWAVAESLLWKSLLAELAAGNAAGIAADWANLGLLAGIMGDLEAAKQRLWWALKIHHRQHDRFHQALDLLHLAQIFEVSRDWSTASKLFARAVVGFATAGHGAFEASARASMEMNAARNAVLQFDPQSN